MKKQTNPQPQTQGINMKNKNTKNDKDMNKTWVCERKAGTRMRIRLFTAR
jgi:hypothetical protein